MLFRKTENTPPIHPYPAFSALTNTRTTLYGLLVCMCVCVDFDFVFPCVAARFIVRRWQEGIRLGIAQSLPVLQGLFQRLPRTSEKRERVRQRENGSQKGCIVCVANRTPLQDIGRLFRGQLGRRGLLYLYPLIPHLCVGKVQHACLNVFVSAAGVFPSLPLCKVADLCVAVWIDSTFRRRHATATAERWPCGRHDPHTPWWWWCRSDRT